jgi:hypothetical protein
MPPRPLAHEPKAATRRRRAFLCVNNNAANAQRLVRITLLHGIYVANGATADAPRPFFPAAQLQLLTVQAMIQSI